MTLTKYDEIMNHIHVTEEMSERITANLRRTSVAPVRQTPPSRKWIRKIVSAAACLMVLIAGAAVLPSILQPADNIGVDPNLSIGASQPGSADLTQAVPDIETCTSLSELSETVGFAVKEPSLPFTPEQTEYTSSWHDLAQIAYTAGGKTALYRMSLGTEDNSGDYNAYEETVSMDADGLSLTLKGDESGYTLGVWTDGSYSYSLSLSEALSEADWLTLISGK